MGIGGDQIRKNPPRLGQPAWTQPAAERAQQLEPHVGSGGRRGHLAHPFFGHLDGTALEKQRIDGGAE